jgi:pyridoxamine 5'-phosphate oxidase
MESNDHAHHIQHLRQEYKRHSLSESDVSPDPFIQFDAWLREAIAAELPEPHAMVLSTVDAQGSPGSRVVLLRDYGVERGFVFYTNYNSRKGKELRMHPKASLLFFWPSLERQIRIEGEVVQVSEGESDAYFASRPRGSQLGAWASEQSEPVPNRTFLEDRIAEAETRFAGKEVQRPPHWGGFRLLAHSMEFWQGRRSRLHDRIHYQLNQTTWRIERLSP